MPSVDLLPFIHRFEAAPRGAAVPYHNTISPGTGHLPLAESPAEGAEAMGLWRHRQAHLVQRREPDGSLTYLAVKR